MREIELEFGPKMPWGGRAYFVKAKYEIERGGHDFHSGFSVDIKELKMFDCEYDGDIPLYTLENISDHYLDQIKEEILCQHFQS